MDFLLAHFKLKKAQTKGRPVVYLILYALHTCVRNNYFLRLLFNSKRNETVIWMCESVFAYIKRHFHRALTCSLSSSPKNIHNNQNTRHTHTHENKTNSLKEWETLFPYASKLFSTFSLLSTDSPKRRVFYLDWSIHNVCLLFLLPTIFSTRLSCVFKWF